MNSGQRTIASLLAVIAVLLGLNLVVGASRPAEGQHEPPPLDGDRHLRTWPEKRADGLPIRGETSCTPELEQIFSLDPIPMSPVFDCSHGCEEPDCFRLMNTFVAGGYVPPVDVDGDGDAELFGYVSPDMNQVIRIDSNNQLQVLGLMPHLACTDCLPAELTFELPDPGIPFSVVRVEGGSQFFDIDSDGLPDRIVRVQYRAAPAGETVAVQYFWFRNLLPPPVACSTDVDGSGDVSFDDLLLVLSTWGPCPE